MNLPILSEDSRWAAVVAEAATWIALLHGPDRTPAAERGLRRWLAETPLHAQAFELATETWNETRASVKRGARVKLILPGEPAAPRRRPWRPVLAAAAVLLVVIVSGIFYLSRPGVATGIGERRMLTLEDGTQVSLNTATRIVVDYNKHRRHVRLDSGEALFEVARRPQWPFVVTVGDREVTALGTAFLVRRDEGRIAVTLIEGKISILSPPPLAGEGRVGASLLTLTPGQRLTFAHHHAPSLDRPEVSKLTAWQQGKVHIENLTLAQAIAEMNRYSALQLEVEGAQASTLRLSGVFRIGDSRNFANAVARTHGLNIREEGNHIRLSGTPASSAR